MQLSPHFHLSEFTSSQTATRRRIDNTPTPAVIAALKGLCEHVLEPVRKQFGPVKVSSGYRSPALNRAVGGSKTSQHVFGQAADIECPGVSNAELARWIVANCPYDQVILEFFTPGQPNSGWVHVAWKPGALRRSVLTAARVKRLGMLRTQYLPGIAT